MTSKPLLARASRTAATLAACILIGGAAQASPKSGNAERPADRPAAEKKYCVERPNTGTMLPSRVCKTAEQWRRAGVEIPRK